MSRTPSLAVVIEGGMFQTLVMQDWPSQVPLPRIAVVDYDTDDAAEEDLVHFTIGDAPAEAIGHSPAPDVYESFARALSPRDFLAALGEPVDDGQAESALTVARRIHGSIQALDQLLKRKEQSPTGDDYKQLYTLANCGLITVLKAMGDTTDFSN